MCKVYGGIINSQIRSNGIQVVSSAESIVFAQML